MPYAEPKTGVHLKDCTFYHRMDIPGTASKTFQWDLIGDESRYLGGFAFDGKRVLEIGPANGGLSFWMERQGAEVVGADLSPDPDKHSWDVMWRPGMDREAVFEAMKRLTSELNNGWWFAHEYFKSRARFVHATAYDTPAGIGDFDAVVLAALLLHLRDPLRALENAANLTREWIITTEVTPLAMTPAELKRPLALFVPNPENVGTHGGITWWHFSPELLVKYLELKGFKIESRTTGDYRHISRPRQCFTIVARRV